MRVLDGGGEPSLLCPSSLSFCQVWQPVGQLAWRPITEFPLISGHDETREAGREWEWPKSDSSFESEQGVKGERMEQCVEEEERRQSPPQ